MSTAAGGLKELHRLHIRLQQVNETLERGPRQIRARQQFVERKQSDLEEYKAQFKQLRMAVDQKSLQLKTNENKIVELKAKLNMASSNREFEIFKTQIDADTMANSVLEDEILESLDKIDQMQVATGKCQQEVEAAMSEESRITDEVAAAEPGLREETAELESALQAAEHILSGSVAEAYRRLVQAHGAGALASVENKACTACHAILSPNPLVEVNTGKIILCRSCGRLLYLASDD